MQVKETPELFHSLHLPYINSIPPARVQWVHNVLEGKVMLWHVRLNLWILQFLLRTTRSYGVLRTHRNGVVSAASCGHLPAADFDCFSTCSNVHCRHWRHDPLERTIYHQIVFKFEMPCLLHTGPSPTVAKWSRSSTMKALFWLSA